MRELAMHQRNLIDARQRKAYFEIRSAQRKEYDQKAYLKAFEADQPWPNPLEVAEYKKMKALRNASLNWEDRVPKTTRYNKKVPVVEEKKAESEGGGGGH